MIQWFSLHLRRRSWFQWWRCISPRFSQKSQARVVRFLFMFRHANTCQSYYDRVIIWSLISPWFVFREVTPKSRVRIGSFRWKCVCHCQSMQEWLGCRCRASYSRPHQSGTYQSERFQDCCQFYIDFMFSAKVMAQHGHFSWLQSLYFSLVILHACSNKICPCWLHLPLFWFNLNRFMPSKNAMKK